ncbi:MAG TPA: xanthine dehydrogenase family protein molybdopterin-binding subunit [Flexilinea sp.]|nr:xanthine dehydrogenase family protein molybdopterin-binding subunit [Flexilinea sp.]
MDSITNSIKKRDHDPKISGRAKYVDDLRFEGMLYGKILRSTIACGIIKGIHIPDLPSGYTIVDKNDVPGVNIVHVVDDDTPVFSDGTVNYVGEPILMVVGEDQKVLKQILSEIIVDYEEAEPVLDMMKSETVFYHYGYTKGNPEKAFREADKIIDETFHTGYQEHVYMEVQGMIGFYENGKSIVRGSMQCPYYVHTAVKKVMGAQTDQEVEVIQEEMGGAFGGKEDYPSILGSQVAVAAKKVGRPVKCVFEREEDIICTSKRHPATMRYRAAIKDNRIAAIQADVVYNCGAYTTLSPVVLQRGLIGATGVYTFDNIRVEGKGVKTNTTPNGAFRGFGGPQTFFAIEMFMNHLAKEVGSDPLPFKRSYLSKQGDTTATNGKYHFYIPMPEMLEKILKASDYERKYESYKRQTSRYRKGIGLSMVYHGCGFTGSGERDTIKGVVKLHKNVNNTVEILTAGTDMGQGLKTTFSKIVAKRLEIPIDQIIIRNPDTDRVPNSGPTAASRSLMVVGRLLDKAALKLKECWVDEEEQEITERYVHPDFVIPWDLNTFQGDAYPDNAWSVNVVEVEVDTLTAVSKVIGAWGVYDVGTPIDMAIIQGQMQGGFLQGIGYGSIELMDVNEKGIIRNNTLSDYIIPTAMDVPHLETDVVNFPYIEGPFGGKGAGELPAVGGAPAYVSAMESALGKNLYKTPFSQEDAMKVLEEIKK